MSEQIQIPEEDFASHALARLIELQARCEVLEHTVLFLCEELHPGSRDRLYESLQKLYAERSQQILANLPWVSDWLSEKLKDELL